MRNIFFIFFLWIAFSACIERIKPESPTLTITPDTLTPISVVSGVIFEMRVTSSENLDKLSIRSYPRFYEYDTTFGDFQHRFVRKFPIEISDQLQINSDSIITMTFKISNTAGVTDMTRKLKVVNGFPPITSGSVENMCYGKDSAMFFSFDEFKKLRHSDIENHKFDLVLLYTNDIVAGTEWGFILASPAANYVSKKFNSSELALFYTTTGKRKTKISRLKGDFDEIDAKFLYYLSVNSEFINDNGGNGVGVIMLKVNDLVALQLKDERKVIIKITNVDVGKKTISFDYKIQKKQ